jgi:hypothetical protein
MRTAIVILASVILFAAGAASAADLKLVPRSTPKPAPTSATPSADVPIQAYGKHDASCVTWTDGCRNCERSADGSTCSNIGIACQPGAIKCTGRK